MGRCHWKEGITMSNNSNIHTPYPDDASWAGLFEMAETYEEQEELPVYDNIEFFESPSAQDKQYDSPEEVLKALFGYDSFRAGQKEVIDSILAGRDACAVMPTGAGNAVIRNYDRDFTADLTDAGSGEVIK